MSRACSAGAIDADAIRVVRLPLRVTCLQCGHEAEFASDGDLVMLDQGSRLCAECRSDEVRLDGGADWEIRAGWVEEGAG